MRISFRITGLVIVVFSVTCIEDFNRKGRNVFEKITKYDSGIIQDKELINCKVTLMVNIFY